MHLKSTGVVDVERREERGEEGAGVATPARPPARRVRPQDVAKQRRLLVRVDQHLGYAVVRCGFLKRRLFLDFDSIRSITTATKLFYLLPDCIKSW